MPAGSHPRCREPTRSEAKPPPHQPQRPRPPNGTVSVSVVPPCGTTARDPSPLRGGQHRRRPQAGSLRHDGIRASHLCGRGCRRSRRRRPHPRPPFPQAWGRGEHGDDCHHCRSRRRGSVRAPNDGVGAALVSCRHGGQVERQAQPVPTDAKRRGCGVPVRHRQKGTLAVAGPAVHASGSRPAGGTRPRPGQSQHPHHSGSERLLSGSVVAGAQAHLGLHAGNVEHLFDDPPGICYHGGLA